MMTHWGSTELLTERCSRGDVSMYPFPHIVKTDALSVELFSELSREFPPLPEGVGENVRVNLNVDNLPADHRGLSPAWRAFFAAHTSTAFFESIRDLFAGTRAAPWLGVFGGKICQRVLDSSLQLSAAPLPTLRIHARMQFQLAYHTGASSSAEVQSPHTDLPNKLFTCLFYMRAADDLSTGGSLDLHERLTPSAAKRLGPGDSRVVKSVPYGANTLVLFPNSVEAVHSVSQRSASTAPRRFCFAAAEVTHYNFRRSGLFNWLRISLLSLRSSASR